MNVFNRLLTIVVLLVGAAAGSGGALIVLGSLTVQRIGQVWPYTPATTAARDLATLMDPTRSIVLVGAIVLAVLCVVLFLSEFTVLGAIGRNTGRARRRIMLQTGPQGYTDMPLGAFDNLARQAGEGIAGIRNLRTRVEQPEQGVVVVHADADITRSTDLPAAGSEVEHRIAALLEGVTGVRVREVRVRVHLHAPAPESRVARSPASASGPKRQLN